MSLGNYGIELTATPGTYVETFTHSTPAYTTTTDVTKAKRYITYAAADPDAKTYGPGLHVCTFP